MIALLFPWIVSAILTLSAHETPMPASPSCRHYDPHQPVVNVVLGLLSYLPVAAVVPLALLLLARTGQRPSDLGLTSGRLARRRASRSAWPQPGSAASSCWRSRSPR